MVFAINAADSGEKTFPAFQQAAQSATSPGSSNSTSGNPQENANAAPHFGASISSALGIVAVAFALLL
jgi:hypothetical protein